MAFNTPPRCDILRHMYRKIILKVKDIYNGKLFAHKLARKLVTVTFDHCSIEFLCCQAIEPMLEPHDLDMVDVASLRRESTDLTALDAGSDQLH